MSFNINYPLSAAELQAPIKNYCSPTDTVFHINTTIEELLQILRNKKILHDVYYFYAVDDYNRLCGVIPTRDILSTSPEKHLIEIVDEDVISLYEGVSVEHALKILTEHQYLSVPIVDDEYHLLGVFEITAADIHFTRRYKKRPMKEIQDIFQIIGFSIEKSKLDSKWKEYRYRIPWLLGNLFAGLACAAIAAFFKLTLSKFVLLALFIPLVLTLSESISMQSMTISLQFLHHSRISWKDIIRRIAREWWVSMFLGLTCAFLLMLYYTFNYNPNWYPDLAAISIASSIFLSMCLAASFGTLFPLLLHRLSLDPKIAAGPVVLMMTDIMTTAVYLGMSTWLLL